MAFVIKEHRPGRLKALVVLLALLWAGSLYLLYSYGWHKANTGYEEVVRREKALAGELEQMAKDNRDMRMRISVLNKSAQVDREAKAGIAYGMKDLQDQVARLREEVSFYKSIVSPAKGKTGLDIYAFRLMPAEGRLFHYKLVLIQAGNEDVEATGVVDISLQGVLNGAEKTLKLADIQIDRTRKVTYKFKYFEELGGSFRLPEGYFPRDIVVKLFPSKSGKKRNITSPAKTFDWMEARRGESHGIGQQKQAS